MFVQRLGDDCSQLRKAISVRIAKRSKLELRCLNGNKSERHLSHFARLIRFVTIYRPIVVSTICTLFLSSLELIAPGLTVVKLGTPVLV